MSDWKSEMAEAGQGGKLLAESMRNIELMVQGTSDPRAEESIRELVTCGHWEELNDRFYKTLEFGTGGLRGRTIGRVVTAVEQGEGGPLGRPEFPCVGTAAMNYYNLGRAIRGFVVYVRKHHAATGQERKPVFAFAHDTRHFSKDFAQYCARVCADLGCDAYLFDGPRATPQLSFAVRALRADGGAVLTASHNPPHDNGFKAYFEDGAQIVEPHASGIIAEVNALASDVYEPVTPGERGEIRILGAEMDGQYKAKLRTLLLRPELLRGRSAKVVFTNLHGTGGWIVAPMLRELGFEVLTVPAQDTLDGRFPTVESPNPENAAALGMAMELAEREEAGAVIGTDPDGDRMGVAVRNAAGALELLSGNQIGTLLAWYRIKTFFAQGILTEANRSHAVVAKTYVTTDLQTAVAQRYGIGVVNTLTGFKYIGEKLRKYEEAIPEAMRRDYRTMSEEETRALRLAHSKFFVFGGEESYGYLGADFVRDKDGNGSVVMFAELAAYAMSEGKTIPDLLDDLFREYGVYLDRNESLVKEGAEGAAAIKALTDSYSRNPPQDLDGCGVSVRDFSREDIYDEEGDLVPKSGMIVGELDDGRRFAVRPSGTEPKIKYYLFGKDAPGAPDLEASKTKVRDGLERLWKCVEREARERIGE